LANGIFIEEIKEKRMIIANPIYDTTFKRLLENDRVAKFLIGTILNCKVLSLEPSIQEYTEAESDTPKISLFRKDFAATIETEKEGKKRVIIEMQKAKILGDVYRFKNYLGDEYKKSKFPIISIYILGFDLSVDSPAFTARPDCWDLTSDKRLDIHDDFVEHLTHQAYFIQTLQIKPSFNTKLEKLLSIFEQRNFIGGDKTTKSFPFETDDGEMKEVLGVLQYVAADEKTREELSRENYYQEAMKGIFGEKDRELEEAKRENEEVKKENEGLKREKILNAQKMKRRGFSQEDISEFTGLSTEEINSL
jgi:hypothetical protein